MGLVLPLKVHQPSNLGGITAYGGLDLVVVNYVAVDVRLGEALGDPPKVGIGMMAGEQGQGNTRSASRATHLPVLYESRSMG
jgi:hypothetical protein